MKFKGKTKIYQFEPHDLIHPCGFMVGFAGTASDIAQACAFFANPEAFKQPPRIRGLTGLVLDEKKNLFIFDSMASWLRVDQKFAAIGSGSPYALGALEQGASPKDAVKAAMQHDCFTGQGIKTYTFN
jgi:hypothetical protein